MLPAVRMLVLSVPAADVELAGDRLWAAGATAVEERDEIDGRVELRTVLAADDDISTARLGDVSGEWRLTYADAADAPAVTWRDHAAPISVAPDLIIRPAWIDPVDAPGVTEVEIEPGASFGLGDHPTTRLSAAAVWRASPTNVLDVGCGSGVLAIVAALRGAERVVAIDIAEAAREATAHNAERNRVADRITTSTVPVAEIEGRFDLVTANILAPTLVAMSGDLRRVTAPGGTLIISGVLVERHDHVLAALAPLEVVRTDELDGWVAVELRAPSAGE